MKIAMIGQKGIPAKSGGVEKHVEEISTRLVRQGYDVTVYCRSTYIDKNMNEYKGVKIKVIKTIDNKNLDAIVYTYRALKDALSNNFDVIHFHAIGPASLAFIPALKGKKVVVTVHGLDWQRGKWGRFAKLYLKFGEHITGKYATKIITVSKGLREYFIKKYKRKEEDVEFIPNGVEINELQEPNLIKRYGLDKGNYILFLARLVPEKGAHYLIQAYNQIKTDKKLVIAGGSSYTDGYVEKLIELANNNKNIIFTGNVQGKLKAELYSNCYVYVLPSDIEGMPLTLLEAMSYDVPCLTSNIRENLDVIQNGKYGFSFNMGDIQDLESKLKDLFSKKIIYNTHSPKTLVENEYNWDNICSHYFKVIN